MNTLRKKWFSSGQMALIERLLRDQGRKHAKGYAIAFAMMWVIASTTTRSAWIMKDIIDRIFVDRSIEAMWAIGATIVAIYTAKGFATYGQQVVLSKIANNIIAEIQTRIFDKMLAMDISFYNARHSTEFIARQAFIAQSASGALNLLITALGRDILTTVGLGFAMFMQDRKSTRLNSSHCDWSP
jgi:ATP-binding cassette, subfamily B, bacterial MsbA